jgi:hypothetical protein
MTMKPRIRRLAPDRLDAVSGGMVRVEDRGVTREGGDGEDQLWGTAKDDEVHGGFGNDLVSGMDGRDTLRGDAGNDVIHGGTGDDLIYDGPGRDTVYAGDGHDDIFATRIGADWIEGGRGSDELAWMPIANGTVFDGGQNIDGTAEADGIVLIHPTNWPTLAYGELGPPEIVLEPSGKVVTVGMYQTLEFDGPMSGVVKWGGSTLTFRNVETISLIPESHLKGSIPPE